MSIPQSGGGLIERHEQLAEYLASGCKPKSDWRIGTEHEKFGYLQDSLGPLPYDGPRSIKAMLEGLQKRFGWDPVLEGDNIIGLFQGMFEDNILTFNPGWDSDAKEVNPFTDVRAIQAHLKEQGIAFETEADADSTGPAHFILTDPDGNVVMFDQHR